MARGNLLLGKAKGKLGSVVFAQANGEQVTRSKPESVRNPKTTGQNTQRAILATIAKSAAAMYSLVDHSFANVAYGAESVRHFRKINLGFLRNLYINTQNDANLVAKGGNFVPNPLKISEGSLPSFYAVVNDGDVAFQMNSTATLPVSDDVTVSDFLDAYPGIKGGDQITLVKIVKSNEGDLLNGDALFTMSLDRIVFAPNAFDDKDAIIITEAAGTIERDFLDLTRTTDPTCVSINTEGGLGFTSEGDVYYAALILSRKVNNKWQRSTQYLAQVEFDDHTNNEAAIASYGNTESVNAQTEYLNQADEGTGKKGVKGSYAQFYSQIDNEENGLTSVDAGQTGADDDVNAPADSEILLTCSGFGTADNPIVKCTIYNADTLLIMGQKYCEYLFKLTDDSASDYHGRVMFRDGSKAEITWNVTVQE